MEEHAHQEFKKHIGAACISYNPEQSLLVVLVSHMFSSQLPTQTWAPTTGPPTQEGFTLNLETHWCYLYLV